MPSQSDVDLSATAGDLDGSAFFEGQTVQRNDATGEGISAAVAQDTAGTTEVTPGVALTQETPIRPHMLFAGTGGQALGTPPTQNMGEGAVMAALRGEALACSAERLRELFMWQPDLGMSQRTEFMEEAIMGHSAGIVAFACVQQGSPVVKLIHGITRYLGRDAAELRKSFLGRVGEWTHESSPHIVELPVQKSWDWKKIDFADDIEGWGNHVEGDVENKYTLFVPNVNATKKEKVLPLMAYMPPPLAVFAHEKERTCQECYLFLKGMAEDPESGVDLTHVEFLMDFFMAAGQGTGGNGAASHKSALQESFKAVISVNPAFLKWAKGHMMAYLGQTPLQSLQAQTTPATQGSFNPNAFMQSAVSVIKDLSQQQVKALDEKKSEKGTLMSEYALAALMGYAGVTSWRELPGLYPVIKSIKDNTEAREVILQGMTAWSVKNGIEISENLYFPEELIKNIRAVKPNPTGMVGVSRVSDTEVTNLACLPLRVSEIEARVIGESALSSTEANRTKTEKEKQLKGESRNPPDTYFGVKLNVATTAALISVCYGQKSVLYQNLINIYNILKRKQVAQASLAFTPLFCRQITWAIVDDMKSFFAKRLMPDDFKQGVIDWPQSLLPDIFPNLNFQNPIERRTFPYAWMLNKDKGSDNALKQVGTNDWASGGANKGKQGGGGGGTGGGYSGGYSMQPQMWGGQQNPFLPPPPPGYSPYIAPPVGTKFEHLHPKMKTFMAEYHKLVRKHQINTILERGGKRQEDLPVLKEYINPQTGRSGLCWNFLTGECFYGASCIFGAGHVPGARLPDGFVDDSIKVLKAGVEAIVSSLKQGQPKGGTKRPFTPGSSYYTPQGDGGKQKR